MTYKATSLAKPQSPALVRGRASEPMIFELPALTLANGKHVTTATLTNQTCRWPIGDPAHVDFHYCGHPSELGSVYCDVHDRMRYNRSVRRGSSWPSKANRLVAISAAKKRAAMSI